eukprot:COSAG02_NODE_14663_length_1250_cov_1.443962_2_plen_146_part_00
MIGANGSVRGKKEFEPSSLAPESEPLLGPQDAVAAALAREHGQGTNDGATEQMVGRMAASFELPGAAAVLSDGDDDANDDFVDSDKKPATAGVVHERKVPILFTKTQWALLPTLLAPSKGRGARPRRCLDPPTSSVSHRPIPIGG